MNDEAVLAKNIPFSGKRMTLHDSRGPYEWLYIYNVRLFILTVFARKTDFLSKTTILLTYKGLFDPSERSRWGLPFTSS